MVICNGKTDYKQPFSVAMLVYQRVDGDSLFWMVLMIFEYSTTIHELGIPFGPTKNKNIMYIYNMYSNNNNRTYISV